MIGDDTSPYKMRLSLNEKFEDICAKHKNDDNLTELTNFSYNSEKEPDHRENCKLKHCELNFRMLDSVEPIIKTYDRDLIIKKKHQNFETIRSEFKSQCRGGINKGETQRGHGYLLKCARGDHVALQSGKNIVQRRFYQFFDSSFAAIKSNDHVTSNSNHLIGLHEVHLQPRQYDSGARKAKKKLKRRLEFVVIPKVIPASFLNESKEEESVIMAPPLEVNHVNTTISASSQSLDAHDSAQIKEAKNVYSENNSLKKSLTEVSEEKENKAYLHSSCMFFSTKEIQATAEDTNRRMINSTIFEDDVSNQARANVRRTGSVAYDCLKDDNPTRDSSLKGKEKFKVLEQGINQRGVLNVLVIFNDTITIKAKLLPPASMKARFKENDTLCSDSSPLMPKINPQKLNIITEEAMEEGDLGKYQILRMKPYMFSRDSTKNRLLEYSLKYVEKHCWFDTLFKFFELVDTMYNDLLAFYGRLVKEFSVSNTSMQTDARDGQAVLSAVGQIKSAKLNFKFALQNISFSVELKEDLGASHLPFSPVKKIPANSERFLFNSSLVDALAAFRHFISSFA